MEGLVLDSVKKDLRNKISDYSQFAKILLMISVFFSLGIAFQGTEKSLNQLFTMMGVTLAFLLGSTIIFSRVKKLQKILNEELEEDNLSA
ncbi:MAG: YrhC-like protein [Bacillales bacterium]|nr:YrhC-like protein [Bacillales bacterium]